MLPDLTPSPAGAAQYLWSAGARNVIVNGWVAHLVGGKQGVLVNVTITDRPVRCCLASPAPTKASTNYKGVGCLLTVASPPHRTTGEFPSMTLEERMHVTELARAHWPGVIINNVSSTAVLDARRLLEHSCQSFPTAQVGAASPARCMRCQLSDVTASKWHAVEHKWSCQRGFGTGKGLPTREVPLHAQCREGRPP